MLMRYSRKTQIAIEYAYRLRSLKRPIANELKPPPVFWVHGSSYKRFLRDYREIYKISKLPIPKDMEDSHFDKKMLESRESGDWVSILDNAYDLDNYYLTATAMTDEDANGFH